MKRYVNASIGQTEKLHDLVAYLSQEGIDEHEMLMHFFDNLPSSQCYDMLIQLAEECYIDLEDFYNEEIH